MQESLAFEGMFDNAQFIHASSPETCHWIQDSEAYQDWIHWHRTRSYGRLLWIKGKPGSGKSTLVRHLEVDILRNIPRSAIASFYFGASSQNASPLQNTLEGVYRSLCHQLLPYITSSSALGGLGRICDTIGNASHRHASELQYWLKSLMDQSSGKYTLQGSPVASWYASSHPCEHCNKFNMKECPPDSNRCSSNF